MIITQKDSIVFPKSSWEPGQAALLPAWDILNRWSRRIEREWAGRRGLRAKRELRDRFFARHRWSEVIPSGRQAYRDRLARKKQRAAEHLARHAEVYYDDHGSSRGDYRTTRGIDYVPPDEARQAPYCDLGGRGLGLISVLRRRHYSRSSGYFPSTACDVYLVGRNEAGTYFAHPVHGVASVRSAVQWIWRGRADQIIQRQGDIALIRGSGPKLPNSGLPAGHEIDEEAGVIRHATHPDLPMPGKGERIIVGRRASERAAWGTRD